MKRIPTAREYARLTFAEKQAVLETVRELLWTYLATERHTP
jgi:hypothetical protein